MSPSHPILLNFLLSISIFLPIHIVSSLSIELFGYEDTMCTGIPSQAPIEFTPLLPGYCYSRVFFAYANDPYRNRINLMAYCDGEIAYYTTYSDNKCTKLIEYATTTSGTCASIQFINNTLTNTRIRINCNHELPSHPNNPGPYMNVSATYYSSSSNCSSSSFSIPPGPNHECITIDNHSYHIDCDTKNNVQMSIYENNLNCNSSHENVVVAAYTTGEKMVTNTTCAMDQFPDEKGKHANRSAYIDCGSIPYNGQPINYTSTNQSYIVTGIFYSNTIGKYCDSDLFSPTPYGPFSSGSCQLSSSKKSSYMITCSDDGYARINIFHDINCTNSQFFSFAQGTADGKTCLPFSMANGDKMFQSQSTTIRCQTSLSSSASSLVYHGTYTMILCLLIICMNTFAFTWF